MKSENKLLTTSSRYSAYGGKCQVCKKHLAAGGKWCNECAHVRGICYICGKQILETSMYSHHTNSLLNMQKSKAAIEADRPAAPTTKPKPKNPPRDELDMAEKQALRAHAAVAAKEKMQGSEHAAVGSGPSAAGAGAHGEADFIPSATFTGSKHGYVFKKGPTGVGYYKDPAQAEAESASPPQTAGRGSQKAGGAAGESWPKSLRTAGEWYELQGVDGRVYYFNGQPQTLNPNPQSLKPMKCKG
jgi:hypothetical protein